MVQKTNTLSIGPQDSQAGISPAPNQQPMAHTVARAAPKGVAVSLKFLEVGGGSLVRGSSPRFQEVGGDSSKFAEVRGFSWRSVEVRGWKFVEVRGSLV